MTEKKSFRNLLSVFLAAVIALSCVFTVTMNSPSGKASAAGSDSCATIYFFKNDYASQMSGLRIYSWDSKDNALTEEWSGTLMTEEYSYYTAQIPRTADGFIIYDGQSGQYTVDIPLYQATRCYVTMQSFETVWGKWEPYVQYFHDDYTTQPTTKATTKATSKPVVTTTKKTDNSESSLIYVTRNSILNQYTNQSNQIRIFAWDKNYDPVTCDWPGMLMDCYSDYYFTASIPKNAEGFVIYDERSGINTEDIPLNSASRCYVDISGYDSQWNKWTANATYYYDTTTKPVATTTKPVATSTAPQPNAKTVYFTDSGMGWTGISIYAWDSNGDGVMGDWPGTRMKFEYTNDYEGDYYSARVPADAVGMVFTDEYGSRQTPDITYIGDNEHYLLTKRMTSNGFYEYTTYDYVEETTTVEPITIFPEGNYNKNLKASSYQVSLADSIASTFKVKKECVENYKDPYMIAVMNGEKTTMRDYTTDSSGNLLFKFDKIYPQNLGDTVKTVVFGKTDKNVIQHGAAYSKSILIYANGKLTNSSSSNRLKTLLVSLLNYGAAAQEYIGYKTDELVNAGLTDEQKAYAPASYGALENVKNFHAAVCSNPKAEWNSASLGLGSTVQLITKFTTDKISNKTLKVQIGDSTETFGSEDFVLVEGNKYRFTYPGMYAGSMNTTVKFTLYEGSKAVSDTMTYSVASYAKNNVNSSNTKLANLLKTLMLYGKAAESY